MNEPPVLGNEKMGRTTWYRILLWAVFALIVCSFPMLNNYHTTKQKAGTDRNAYEESASTRFVLLGRYCMGVKSIVSTIPGTQLNSLSDNLLLQIKNSAHLDIERICLIPFIAEFSNLDETHKYIKALKNELDFSPDHPERISAMKPAIRTFIAFIVFFALGCIGGLSGFVLFVVAIVKFAKKRLGSAFAKGGESIPLKSQVYLETTIVFLVMLLLLNLVGNHVSPLIYRCIHLLVMVAALFWPMYRGMGFKQMRMAIGWHKGKGFLQETGAGLLGYLAGMPLIVCGGMITFYFIKNTGANPVHPIVHQFEDAGMLKIIQLVGLASIMAPVLEETIFRGALYRHLRFKHSAIFSALTSGLIFAVIHPQGFAAVPVLCAIGVVFAILREWRGSLIAPMVAHAFNNFLITMMLVFAMG